MDYNDDFEYNKNDIKLDNKNDDKIENDNDNDYIDYDKIRTDYLDYLYDVFNNLHNDIKYKFPLNFLNHDNYHNFIKFIDN